MTIRELYQWAYENDVLDIDIWIPAGTAFVYLNKPIIEDDEVFLE